MSVDLIIKGNLLLTRRNTPIQCRQMSAVKRLNAGGRDLWCDVYPCDVTNVVEVVEEDLMKLQTGNLSHSASQYTLLVMSKVASLVSITVCITTYIVYRYS